MPLLLSYDLCHYLLYDLNTVLTKDTRGPFCNLFAYVSYSLKNQFAFWLWSASENHSIGTLSLVECTGAQFLV